jgi:hypothetical protein
MDCKVIKKSVDIYYVQISEKADIFCFIGIDNL